MALIKDSRIGQGSTRGSTRVQTRVRGPTAQYPNGIRTFLSGWVGRGRSKQTNNQTKEEGEHFAFIAAVLRFLAVGGRLPAGGLLAHVGVDLEGIGADRVDVDLGPAGRVAEQHRGAVDRLHPDHRLCHHRVRGQRLLSQTGQPAHRMG